VMRREQVAEIQLPLNLNSGERTDLRLVESAPHLSFRCHGNVDRYFLTSPYRSHDSCCIQLAPMSQSRCTPISLTYRDQYNTGCCRDQSFHLSEQSSIVGRF
jgi:hypothetical protein